MKQRSILNAFVCLRQVAATSAATIRATGGVHREVESEFNTDQECLTDFSASEDLPPEDA